ncbi:MAG: phage portal protein, partial [Planctomycetia bacterium]|nr:phage portal protein [Planctomycetia bacterium]
MPKTKRRPAKKKKSPHTKELRTQRFAVQDSEEGVPAPEPFFDLMRAYEVSPWAYACVFAIASNLASIDYKFWKELAGDKFEAFKNHPIDDLIKNPNPYMTEYDVKEATFSYMELTGEAYWILEDNGTGEANELWPVPPHLMKPVQTKEKFIDHYLMNVGGGKGIRFEIDEVIQFKSFSPTSMHRGQGSTLAARNSLTLDLFQQTYNRVFFLNNARPDAILQVQDHLDPDVRRRMLRSWENAHKGLKSAHKVALLEGGTKYIKGDTNQKDMEYREGRKQNREEILAAYGCPPVVVGVTEDANYNTAKEQY